MKLFVAEISRSFTPALIIPVSHLNGVNVYSEYFQENFSLLERFIALI